MKYIRYETQQGDRWDSIAWRFYRDQYAWPQIARENPIAPLTPELPEGIVLAIPIIDRAATSELSLPPWKREAAT